MYIYIIIHTHTYPMTQRVMHVSVFMFPTSTHVPTFPPYLRSYPHTLLPACLPTCKPSYLPTYTFSNILA